VVEPSVRRVVADRLGVGSEELALEVSLTDELAADSLDLMDVAVALESEWAIVIPDRTLQAVRTYGDLVDAVTSRLVEDAAPGDAAPAPVPFAWTRIVPAEDGPGGPIERSGELTPYAIELLADDARRAGPGARVEMEFAARSDAPGPTAALHRFGRLSGRAVAVSVRRDRRTPPAA
jgi:acyl carrier protein